MPFPGLPMRVTLASLLAVLLAVTAPAPARAQSDFKLGLGVHGAYPEVAAASISIAARVGGDYGPASNFLLLLEPGLQGGRLVFGSERLLRGGSLMTGLSVLQTWNQPPNNLPPNVTYVGTDARMFIGWVTLGAGFGFRVSGGTTPGGFGIASNAPGFLVTGVLGVHGHF